MLTPDAITEYVTSHHARRRNDADRARRTRPDRLSYRHRSGRRPLRAAVVLLTRLVRP